MIKEIQKIVFALILIQLSASCGEGCLKCSTETQCELCDTLNAYVLLDGSCTRKVEENCKTYNLEGKCQSCQPEFYLQDQVNKCVQVENINLVDNCFEYNNQSMCSVCQQNFYLSGNKCIGVDLKIGNCMVYDTSKTCSMCLDGFLVSISRKQCLPVTPLNHCLSYSLNKCTKCNENSFRDNRLFFKDFLNEKAKDFTGINKYETFMYFEGLPVYYQEFCIRTLVPNCLEFEDYKTCLKCQPGFFLQGNDCRENPNNFISNCSRYISQKECIECMNGFYLFSQSSCLPVDQMTGCKVYDGKASFSSCLRCQDDMFLQTSTTCTIRTHLEIQSCDLLDARLDQCGVCEVDFRLSLDNLKCFQLIERCVEYDTTVTSISNGNVCIRCQTGFYLSNNVCQEGTVENCENFEVSSNTCTKCLNKYFLKDGVCNTHSSLSYCQIYNPITQGVCDVCQVGTEQFSQETYCNPVNQIDNCISYSDINTCSQCALGYNRAQNQCIWIPTEQNCVRAEEGLCLQCKDDYYLENNICLDPLKYELLNCNNKGEIVSGYQKCQSCEELYLSFNYKNHRICTNVDEDFQKYIDVSINNIENCQVMRMNQGVLECLECREQYFLNEQFQCIEEDLCEGTAKRVVFILENNRIVDFRKNVCLNQISSCKLYGISIKNDGTLEYRCAKCADGYDKIIEFSNNEEIIVLSDDMPVEKSKSTFKIIKSECEISQQTQRTPSNAEMPMFPGCEYWYKFDLFGEKGCARCSHQHYGNVENWGVTKCFNYDEVNNKCKQCLNKYEIVNEGLRCSLISQIDNCVWYQENVSTCQKCSPGYYLSQNVCLLSTNVENCAKYQINKIDRCVECNNNLFLYMNSSLQQFCIEPIYKCDVYRYISSNDDSIVCTNCSDGYYPDSFEGCIKGTIDNCWQYEQVSQQNVCKKYINTIPFLSENVCQRVEPIDGCQTYSTSLSYTGEYEIVCSVCDIETHYKSGDICCPYGQFNDDGVCDYILINECKESTSALTCDVCMDYYFFDLYMSELSVPYKCCGIGTYWNPIQSECSKYIEIEGNNNHCVIYEKSKIKSCLVCEEGYYISHNQQVTAADPNGTNFPYYHGYCCPEGTYYSYSAVNGHSCESITISNCEQVNCTYTTESLSYLDTVTCNCTQCNDGFTKNGTGATTVCCNNETEYYDNTSCVQLPDGCAVFNTTLNYCTSCKESHRQYLQGVNQNQANDDDVICCDYNADPRKWYQEKSQETSCTIQGETSAGNVSFNYSGDENCILTNFDDTHATIDDASCIKCIDNFSPSGWKSQKCCPEGFMWNGVQQYCLSNEYFNNCAQVNILTSLNDPFCTQCRNGYYFNNGVCVKERQTFQKVDDEYKFQDILVKNCLQIQNGQNLEDSVCLKCDSSFELVNDQCERKMMITVEQNEYYLPDFVKHCALFDTQIPSCLSCISGAYKWDGILCCLPNEDIIDNKCVEVTGEQDWNLLKESRMFIDNCKFYQDQVCTQCEHGFILVDDQCMKINEAQKSCNYNIINENCQSTSLVNLISCQCDHCQPHAYASDGVCCPLGKKWDSIEQQCVQLQDVLCAKYDGQNCTECFHDPIKRLVVSQYSWFSVLEDGFLIGADNQQMTVSLPDFSADYYVSGGQCCLEGTYNNQGLCDPITIDKCKRAEISSTNTLICTECNDMSLEPDQQDQTNCVNKAETTLYYTPLNSPIKVKLGYYWDVETQRVQKIFDPNCLETKDKRTCSVCATDYSLQKVVSQFVMKINPNAYHNGIKEVVNVRLCVNNGADVLDYVDLKRFNSCLNWDSATKQCTECEKNYYLTQNICCENGQVAILKDGFKICIPIEKQQEGCVAYDLINGTCNNCDTGFTNSYGVCCPDQTGVLASKTYMNIFKAVYNCDLKPVNCYKFNIFSQQCEMCLKGNSLINGQCLENSKFYRDQILVTTSDIVAGCTQLDNDLSCKTPAEGFYLYNGISCAPGFYNPDESNNSCNTPISTIGEMFQKCMKIDIFKRCYQCTSDSYMSNGNCCLKGKYFDTNLKKCLPIYKYKNCLNAWVDRAKDCQKCKEGYYLSQGFCVLEGRLVIDVIGTEKDITITNCVQAQTTTTCQKCQGDQVIFNNTCQYYIDIDEDQRIGECRIIKSGTPPLCLECKEDRYLNNNTCCSYGYYHNGSSCQSLETISLNCKTWLNGQCSQCMPQNGEDTYLSNQLACCVEGFYASSSTLCRPITETPNCNQTDNGISCKKCSPLFKNVNGNCVQMSGEDIPNCLIGKDSSTCLICKEGFYLEEILQQNIKISFCEAQPIDNTCLKWKNNSKDCELCEDQKYWDGKSCCMTEFVSMQTGVSEDYIQCQVQNFIDINNCSKVENFQCIECTNGDKFNGGVCCPVGQFAQNGICTPTNITGLQKCKKFSNIDICEYLTDPQGNDISCTDNYYFNQNGCCPLGTEYKNGQCVSFSSLKTGCQKMRGGMCIQCQSDKQLSLGQCIDVGKVYLLGVETTITSIPHCTKINDQNSIFCDSCAANYTLTLNNLCCTDADTNDATVTEQYYFDPITRTCILILGTGHLSVDLYTGDLLTCVVSGEYPNEQICCAEGKYWDSTFDNQDTTFGACVATVTATDCLYFTAQDLDEYTNCSKCANGFQLIVSDVTQCLTTTSTAQDPLKFIQVDTNYLEINKEHYDICIQKDSSNKCQLCDQSTHYLLMEACVPYENKWTSTTDYTAVALGVTDCKKASQTTPATDCEVCISTHTLTDATTCTAQDLSYPNQDCSVYDGTTTKCTTCGDMAMLYTDQTTTICCRYYEENEQENSPFRTMVASSDLTSCQYFMFEIENCLHYDQTNNQCVECKENYYVAEKQVCCQEGFKFNPTKSKCEPIDEASKCVQEINSVCYKCKPDDEQIYLTNGFCCQNGQYSNSGTCEDIGRNCKQSLAVDGSTCKECLDGYIQYANECCPIGSYHNTTQCTFNTIPNCHEQVSDKVCKSCQKGYVLFNLNNFITSSTDICCKENEFYDQSTKTCGKEFTIESFDADCEIWDRKNMKCSKCKDPKYLTNGRCCSEDQYFDIIQPACLQINTITLLTNLNNCKQMNDQNICIKCSATFFFRKTDNKCIQPAVAVDNCIQYDDQVVNCITCDTGRYLLRNKCPLYNQSVKPADSTFDPLTIDANSVYPITNCYIYVKVDDNINKCQQCNPESSTYLTNSSLNCCPFNQFYNTTTNTCEATNVFPNCKKYTTNQPSDCLECDKGYFLAILKNNLKRCVKFSTPDQECLLSEIGILNNQNTFKCTKCKNQGIEYVLQPDPDRNRIFVQYEPITNCEYYETTDLLSSSTLKCLQCVDNEINYLDNQGDIQQCKVRTQSIGELVIGNCSTFNPNSDDCVTCKEQFHLIQAPNNGPMRCEKNPLNCKIFVPAAGNELSYCSSCIENYEMILIEGIATCVPNQELEQEEIIPPTFYPGYMEECKLNEQCREEYLGGLPASLERLFSCHLCKQEGYIPFVSVRSEGQAILGIQRYRKPLNQNDRQDLGAEFKNSQCHRVSGETFGISEGNFRFPLNCALGILNSNLPAVADSTYYNAQKTRLGVYCAACQPGFRALKSSVWDDMQHVYECSFISNCEEKGNAFNQCDRCKEGFTFKFENGTVKYDECVEFKQDLNCLVTEENNQMKTCRYCQEGYSFNYDNFCEMIELELCEDDEVELLEVEKRPLATEVEFTLQRFRNGWGCNKCSDNQIKLTLFNQERSWFCSNSEYLRESELPTDTKYDPLCRYYKSSQDLLVCHVCLQTAVLNEENKCILRTQELNNCELASDQESCISCSTGYINSLGKCLLKNIDNCVGYEIDPINGDLLCLQCDISYGLTKNVCVKDLFNPCQVINVQGECISCQYGFHLLQLNENQKQCVPVSSHQNCISYVSNEFNIKRIKCDQCVSSKFILQSLETPINVCNQLITIRNCIKYDIKSTFLSSTLNCQECDPAYYLQGNECFFRRNIIENCLNYEPNSELCVNCASTHYLDLNRRQCIENPTGVDFCRIYENKLSCKICNTNYYSSNGKCLSIDQEKRIQGCYTYDSNQTCTECQTEQLRIDGNCISILALNCLTLKNEKECESCQFGFELVRDEVGILSCIEIEKPVIQNCHNVSDIKPFTCLMCFEHHYFDGEKCVPIDSTKKIEYCEVYENQVSCKMCQKYHILSQDKQLCLLEKNRNCEYFEEQKQGFCVRCQPGYVFDTNDQCVQENASRNQNCLLWQPDGAQCLVCASGFSMNTPGSCVENQMIRIAISAIQEEKPLLSGSLIAHLLSMIILAFLF